MRAAHPLAQNLIARFANARQPRVLDAGTGSGRNAAALRAAGFEVVTLGDALLAAPGPLFPAAPERPFDAAVSSHGLLHGTREHVAARIEEIARVTRPHGVLAATFGSVRDARCGAGQRLAEGCWAPLDGDERGVPHAYFDRGEIVAALGPWYAIESLEERGVDEIAGAWAHRERPLAAAVHWFAIAVRQ